MSCFGNLLLSSSIGFLALAVWLTSSDFKPREYHLPPPPLLNGPLSLNKPEKMEKLMEGQVLGPESIVYEKNVIYTCTLDGKCLKIINGKIVKVVPISDHKNCDGSRKTLSYCGRPLGLRRYLMNKFIVADAILGLIIVDFEKASYEILLSSTTKLDGKKLTFLDDFDYADNDTIIFSDAASNYGYNDFLLSFLEHASDGRIVEFKISTGELKTLIDGFNFPNGVQIHPDKQSVLFCESGTAKVHRYYFAGPKKGRHLIFADNLPGFPDNIRLSANGKSLYVALFAHRDHKNPNFFETYGPKPSIRKIVGEIIKIIPDWMVLKFFHASHSSYGIVIELDLTGKIIHSYHDPEGNVIKDISQVTDDGGDFLYLASFANNYIARISKK